VGTAIILIWIGLFKFTPTEAKAIQGVVENSPFMSWLNTILSVQGVSNLVGTFEIVTGLLLLIQFFVKKLTLIAGILASVIFFITLSFLFTTPGMFNKVDGLIVPDAFILKDLVLLGVSLQLCFSGLKQNYSVKE
ncbi:MAG: DUF417 family protein, partial [Chitinophagaceae bacterium]|nr:DUF417 family protein [Chitinophagaceae bacterium]